MTEPFSLKVYRGDLARIVQSVFRTMMDMDVVTLGEPWRQPPDAITAAVHFTGDWRGTTLVECNEQQARLFAQRFMGIPMPPALDDDVRDVLGELANMVAGNLKSLLPKGVDLSIPTVVEGRDYSLHVCGGNIVERSIFTGSAGDFCVTVIELLQRH